jgi:hypothetical protein
MDEYGHYVTYRNETDRIRSRVERRQRSRVAEAPRRGGRHALARGLHSLADRLDH